MNKNSKVNDYVVYDVINGKIAFIGHAGECARFMNISIKEFHEHIKRLRAGTRTRKKVYVAYIKEG